MRSQLAAAAENGMDTYGQAAICSDHAGTSSLAATLRSVTHLDEAEWAEYVRRFNNNLTEASEID